MFFSSDSESDADQLTLASGHESSALSDSNDEYKPESYAGYFSKRTLDDDAEKAVSKKKTKMSLATDSTEPTVDTGSYAKSVFKMMVFFLLIILISLFIQLLFLIAFH